MLPARSILPLIYILLLGACGSDVPPPFPPDEQVQRSKENSLWPEKPDTLVFPLDDPFRSSLLRTYAAYPQNQRFMTESQWLAGRILFKDRITLKTFTLDSIDEFVKYASLRDAVFELIKQEGVSTVGIVVHYGLDTLGTGRDITFAFSMVRLTNTAPLGSVRGEYQYLDEEGKPFYTIMGSGDLKPAAAGKDDEERSKWLSKYAKAYRTRITIKRHEKHGAADADPFRQDFDPQKEVFPFEQLEDLFIHNSGLDKLRFSSIVHHGLDTADFGVGYAHAIAITGWDDGAPIKKDLISDQYGDEPAKEKATDLGNICPPKCRRVSQYPTR